MRRFGGAAVVGVLVITGLTGCSPASPPTDGPSVPSTAVPTIPSGGSPPSSKFVTPPEPATPPNRKLESQLDAEWTDRWLSCMTDSGFPPTVNDAGGYTFPGEQEAVSAAVDACSKQAGPQPTYAPLTPSEASHMYDLELATKKCLEGLGVAVPQPPSRDQYIQDVLSQKSVDGVDVGPHVWRAYDNVLDWSDYSDQCPVPSLWGP